MKPSGGLAYIVLILCYTQLTAGYTNVTDTVFKGILSTSRGCALAAFGDFDANKLTDIFLLCHGGRQVVVLLAQRGDAGFDQKTLISLPDDTAVITSVVPSDFDGDAQMDVLVTLRTQATVALNVSIYWGDAKQITLDDPLILTELLWDEPLILDWNGDNLPDLLAETEPGLRYVWLSGSRKLSRVSFPHPSGDRHVEMRFPQSNAFVDLNADYAADVVIATNTTFEVWQKQDSTKDSRWGLSYTISTDLISGGNQFGQAVYSDINQDGLLDLLLPSNTVSSAQPDSAIFVYSAGKWSQVVESLSHNDENWQFASSKDSDLDLDFNVTLRVADYDLDGYPDLLATLVQSPASSHVAQAFLLLNAPCGDDEDFCHATGRKFVVQWDEPVAVPNHNIILAAFFDLSDDGTVDLLAVSSPSTPSENGSRLSALRNADDASSANFLKILVASTHCPGGCPDSRKPYGVNHIGPTIKYLTTKTRGGSQKGCHSQFSQTAHFALQTPYTVFGLGQTPNFIDELSVGLPLRDNQDTPSYRMWKQIIPNSQLIAIPSPPDKPSRWTLRLTLTPSHAVLVTAAVLLAVCAVLGLIIAILHWKEKREDKKEKRQDAHKFHFDAM